MTRGAVVMACIAGFLALAGTVAVTRPAPNPQTVYIRRIVSAMLFAAALILTVFSWGLTRIAAAG